MILSIFSFLFCLSADFRPGPAELAQAEVIEDWRIEPTVGPFALTGRVCGEDIFAVLVALDVEAGWALLMDRRLKLGCGSGSLAHPDEIMRRAAQWLAEDGLPSSFGTATSPPHQDEGGSDTASEIAIAAMALARRAERVGLVAAAYLLDMAAMEAGTQR